ncbi:glycosyltransferase family 4 protein [Marinobacterium alkalitolerans]|uniref:glycosyltransferase family 4 protein n=1 Tax=Marinobacterium alkalitolerans TaxID=1542925 RepID=UPI001ADDC7C6|nr:glycosyltransferase family 4 protein [Marinobacterium alkalitolerans]
MKVLQALPSLESGGVEKGVLEVGRFLVEQGHESLVLSAGGGMVSQLEQEGSRHIQLDIGRKSPFTFRHVWTLRRLLRRERPDILHLRSRMPAWVFWVAWKGLPADIRPRLVTTVHGLYSVSAYSAVMCKGERVIAVSRTVQNYIHSHYPETDPAKVRLIYRGIEPEEFPRGYQPAPQWKQSWFEQFPQLESGFVLTLPGRLTRLKGHLDFINLIQDLRRLELDVKGVIVGGIDPKRQDYARELQQAVIDKGLQEQVVFTGARRDIRDIYAVSDLVLSLSTQPESFGRTVAEALSLGRPVVGYDHGGVGEILQCVFPEGRVPLCDHEQLLSVVSQQLKQPATVQDMPFLKQMMLEQTLSCYLELSSQAEGEKV